MDDLKYLAAVNGLNFWISPSRKSIVTQKFRKYLPLREDLPILEISISDAILIFTAYLNDLPIPKIKDLKIDITVYYNMHITMDDVFYAFSSGPALCLLERLLEVKTTYGI